MQIGQGESLVHFLCPALPNRPHQTVVVVKSGQDGLSQTLYLQNWPKSAFEIVVRVGRKKTLWSNVANGNANVTVGMSQSYCCRDTVKAERVEVTNGGRRQLVHKMFTNTHPVFCRKNVLCKVKGVLEQQRAIFYRGFRFRISLILSHRNHVGECLPQTLLYTA